MYKQLQLGLVAAALMGLGAAAQAAPQHSDTAAARARFQMDQQTCKDGTSGESPRTCMKEARAALQAALHGQLTHGTPDYAANRLARCDPLQGLDHVACVARMAGAGTIEGSVAGGGILRELTVRYVDDPTTGLPVAIEIPAPTR